MIAWIKTLHIAAIMLWCAGLLALPGLYVRRNGLSGEALHDLHRFTRAAFIAVISPAAFVAILAGIALIFLAEVFTPWMALKLCAVGTLAMIHMRQGHIVLHLYKAGGHYARWRQAVAVAGTLAAILAILWLVLAKPAFDPDMVPAWAREPGGLQSLLETMMPIP